MKGQVNFRGILVLQNLDLQESGIAGGRKRNISVIHPHCQAVVPVMDMDP